jgi:hypothetical protein
MNSFACSTVRVIGGCDCRLSSSVVVLSATASVVVVVVAGLSIVASITIISYG